MPESVLDRFLRYVQIDTQSQDDVDDRYPSTEKQKDLCRLLVNELKAIGLTDAAMDDYGYVMATLPSNLPEGSNKVPVIGFLAHVDTSPEVSGKDVKPIVHQTYQGGGITLPGDPSQIIAEEENPVLAKSRGEDLVTSDGTTLLGADNKAGVAEILTAMDTLVRNPEIKHGDIRVGFTPDEETGRGTDYFDVKRFGAKVAYTVDGGTAGEIENETFNAMAAEFKIQGINVHPGYAKDKLVNAIRIGAEIVTELSADPAPETTEKREGYLHVHMIQGGVEETVIKLLIRDFEESGMEEKSARLHAIREKVAARHQKAQIHLTIQESYKNMKVKLDECPEVVEYAMEAVKRAGIEPEMQIIRGGTDGARLCFMGLPTPNIFTGGQNFHSKREWISVQAMEKAVDTLVHLVQIWTEKSGTA